MKIVTDCAADMSADELKDLGSRKRRSSSSFRKAK